MFNLILTLILTLCVLPLSYADQASTFIQGPAMVESMATVATAGGTTTLTASSVTRQIFTGSSAQTVVLPDAQTLKSGRMFTIVNESSGTLSINTNDTAPLMTVLPGISVELVVKSVATQAGTWTKGLVGANGRPVASLTGNAGTSPGTNFIGTTDANDFVMKANSNEVARLKQSTGSFHITKSLDSAFTTDAATTGSNATVPEPVTLTYRLTNGSLASIDMITAPADTAVARTFVLQNVTGGSVLINDETGATAENRIRTGTGAQITLAANASLLLNYDNTSDRWRVIGGSGGGGGTALVYGSYSSPSSVSAGSCIDSAIVTATGSKVVVFVQGNGGPITCSAGQQILASSTVGDEITVIGRSDSNTLTLINGNGLKLNGDWTGGDGDAIRLMYVTTNTWQELNRSN